MQKRAQSRRSFVDKVFGEIEKHDARSDFGQVLDVDQLVARSVEDGQMRQGSEEQPRELVLRNIENSETRRFDEQLRPEAILGQIQTAQVWQLDIARF